MLNRTRFNANATLVLLHLLGHQTRTLTDLAKDTGLTISSVWHSVKMLQREGLVQYQPGKRGTLHATCQVIR